jgi:ABC-type transporter Mla subunit MlaD
MAMKLNVILSVGLFVIFSFVLSNTIILSFLTKNISKVNGVAGSVSENVDNFIASSQNDFRKIANVTSSVTSDVNMFIDRSERMFNITINDMRVLKYSVSNSLNQLNGYLSLLSLATYSIDNINNDLKKISDQLAILMVNCSIKSV